MDTVPEDHQEEQVSEFTPPVEEINLPTVAAEVALRSSRAEPGPPKSASLNPTQLSPFYEPHSHLMDDPTPGGHHAFEWGQIGGQLNFQAVLPLLLNVPCTYMFIFMPRVTSMNSYQ